MITVAVDDPGHRLASIDVLHESAGAVVLLVDLTGAGKRLDVGAWQGRTFWLGDAEVTIHGDGLGGSILRGAETAGNACLVTMVRNAAGREVYREGQGEGTGYA